MSEDFFFFLVDRGCGCGDWRLTLRMLAMSKTSTAATAMAVGDILNAISKQWRISQTIQEYVDN